MGRSIARTDSLASKHLVLALFAAVTGCAQVSAKPKSDLAAYRSSAMRYVEVCGRVRVVDASGPAVSCGDRGRAEITRLYDAARRELRYQRGTRAYLAAHFEQWQAIACGTDTTVDCQRRTSNFEAGPALARLRYLDAELNR